jgi:hypothetical protein
VLEAAKRTGAPRFEDPHGRGYFVAATLTEGAHTFRFSAAECAHNPADAMLFDGRA